MSVEQQTRIILGGPNIGRGNVDELLLLQEGLKSYKPSMLLIDTPDVKKAGRLHSFVSADVLLSILYTFYSAESRQSGIGNKLQLALAQGLLQMVAEEPNIFIIPQDMTAKGLRQIKPNVPIVIECPDWRGKVPAKLNEKDCESLQPFIHWVWTPDTAKDLADHNLRVQLIRPPDPRSYYTDEAFPDFKLLKGNNHCFFKISGSGIDTGYANAAIRNLQKLNLMCHVVTDDLKLAGKFVCPLISNADYYLNTAKLKEFYLLMTPSEQIKWLALLSREGNDIHALSIYTRGAHERVSYVGACNNDLLGGMCVPTIFQGLVRGLFRNSELSGPIKLVDPNKLALSDFHSPKPWNIPENAISIEEALQQSLE